MIEFHAGIHGSLVDGPPPGVDYRIGVGRVHYWHRPNDGWSPLKEMAVDEVVELSPTGPPVERYAVHTSRVPAHDSVPWVADADCLLATVRLGRDFMYGQAERAPELLDDALSGRRVQSLVGRYLSDACFGVLFHTETFRQSFLDFVDDHDLVSPAECTRLAGRCGVVVPAVGVGPEPDRGTGHGPLRICYASRSGPLKGQDVAVEVFQELKRVYADRVELTWLGQAPPVDLAGVADVRDMLDRPDYLDVISGCDVYFAPSTSETLGMAMLEATALGAVVVTGAGRGVPHMEEIFTDGEDGVVIAAGSRQDRVRSYLAAFEEMLDDPSISPRLASRAHLEAKRRLADRNDRLLGYYDEMFDSWDRTVAQAVPLGDDGDTGSGWWKSSVELSLLEAVHQHRWVDKPRHLTFDGNELRTTD